MPRDALNQDLCDDDLDWIQTVLDRVQATDAYIRRQTDHHTQGAQTQHNTMARAEKTREHLSEQIRILEHNMTNLLIGIGWKAETDIHHESLREFRIIPWNSKKTFGCDQDMADAMNDVSPKKL